ncbi:hypothetical protein HK405_007590, partial [Cladochytrium tenue]
CRSLSEMRRRHVAGRRTHSEASPGPLTALCVLTAANAFGGPAAVAGPQARFDDEEGGESTDIRGANTARSINVNADVLATELRRLVESWGDHIVREPGDDNRLMADYTAGICRIAADMACEIVPLSSDRGGATAAFLQQRLSYAASIRLALAEGVPQPRGYALLDSLVSVMAQPGLFSPRHPDGEAVVAIGYLTQDPQAASASSPGRYVEILRARKTETLRLNFWFFGLTQDFDAPGDITGLHPQKRFNIFAHELEFRYFEEWIDPDRFPPRSKAFPADPEPMHFAGELYELVNSRRRPQDSTSSQFRAEGGIPGMDYGGLEHTLIADRQHYLRRCSVTYTKALLEAGKTGRDLWPGILQDFRAYLVMRPDVWPSVVPARRPAFQPRTSGQCGSPSPFGLPLVAMSGVIAYLRLSEIAQLLQCSSAAFSTIISLFQVEVIRRATTPVSAARPRTTLPSGNLSSTAEELSWLLPVPSVPGECESAFKAVQAFLDSYPAGLGRDSGLSVSDRVSETGFGRSAFTSTLTRASPEAACAFVATAVESMKTRRWMWAVALRFRLLWRDYRVHGWECGGWWEGENG